MAGNGLRFTHFYNTARCCPSRASLLTGLHPHQADVGHMMDDDDVDGYLGDLSRNAVTIAEALGASGYGTYMSGKWHVTRHIDGPKHNWPRQRGFDHFYGIITGACSYFDPSTLTIDNQRIDRPDTDFFMTDVIADEAVAQIERHAEKDDDAPFFQYVAFTAPHWPLHAHPEDIARYKGRFDAGWDVLREERLARMVEMGLIDPEWQLTGREPSQPAWEDAKDKEWQVLRMEVYAAQIDRMDQGIGRILDALCETDQRENTLIVFLADNGGCAEEITSELAQWLTRQNGHYVTHDGRSVQYGNDPKVMPGADITYQSYGIPWANVSNTPFREYKHWVHEGGIATPLIVHWPGHINGQGALRHQPAQLPDIMATFLDVADAEYPSTYAGAEIQPLEGFSMTPIFEDEPSARGMLFWEHEGNRAIRYGEWKLVCKYPGDWELYDIENDRTEMHNLAVNYPDIVARLDSSWNKWARENFVTPLPKDLAAPYLKPAK